MNKVLVTGSEGGLGKFLVKSLIYNGYDVIHAGRSQGDLRDPLVVENLYSLTEVDYVIHCASCWNGFNNDFNIAHNNSIITLNILKHCESIRKFIYISSSGVYEGIAEPLESSTLSPTSAYGISKLFSEQLVSMRDDFPFVILRPFHIVSPEEQYKPGSSHICTDMAHKLIEQKISIDSVSLDNEKKLTLTWVEDVVELILLALSYDDSNNEIFNVGTNDTITPQCIGREMERVAFVMGLIAEPPPFNDISVSFLNDERFSKAQRVLGWKAKTRSYQCIKKFLQYKYREHYERTNNRYRS